MRFPPSLEKDLGNFFDSLFTSPNYRKEAARLFDAAVSHHCKNLLSESRAYTSMTDGLLASDPWAQANPKQALKLVELFIRALAASKDAAVRGKQIDIKAMLAERLKHRTIPVRRII